MYYVAEDDLELQILLLPLPRSGVACYTLGMAWKDLDPY